MDCRRVAALLLAALLPAVAAAAPPPVLPPLPFFAARDPLPEELLDDKLEGRYFTGFPAIGYDAATKFNYGVALQLYDDGPADSPFFRYTPYRRKLDILAVTSTGGFSQVTADYDRPYVADTPWRLSLHAEIINDKLHKYFGVGEAGRGPLTYPGSDLAYGTYDDYRKALEQVVDGQTWSRYDVYQRASYGGYVNLEYNLLGGRLRPLLGLEVRHVRVEDYTGQYEDNGVQNETRLRQDFLAGAIRGFDGGWDNGVRFGLTWDTRDFEPDPRTGTMLQLTGRYVPTVFGSDFAYLQTAASARVYRTVIGGVRPLVVAGRFLYSAQFGSVPVYALSNVPMTDGDRAGLGGWETLRGYPDNRYIGKAAMLANGELRWMFGETTVWQQHLAFTAAPFVDVGRSFDSVADTTLQGWKLSAGAGFRLAWNLSTVLSFDLGASGEGTFFSMEIGSQF
jgi:hypothetical protein